MQIKEGQSAEFGFDASYTGTSSQTIVADVQINGIRYILDGTPTKSGSTYTVKLKTLPLPAGGTTTSDVIFRLCTTSACTKVYPNSTKSFTVTLDVELEDWGMYQRNAAHTAYVAANYDPDLFEDAWTWQPSSGYTVELAATQGKIFATELNTLEGTNLVALSSKDGSRLWTRSMGDQSNASGPSYANGKVFVTSMVSSSDANPQWVFDSETGNVEQQMVFAAQWSRFTQPTIFEDEVIVAAGYYGNVVYNFNYITGAKLWQQSGSGRAIWDSQAVAADNDYIYYYSGAGMDVFSRTTGQLLKTMRDPDFDWRGYSWKAAPILDGNGKVFGFSSPRDYSWDTNISGYSMTTGSKIWHSVAKYTTAPAYAHDRLFAARHNLQLIDAINPQSGAVDFSLNFPGSDTAKSNIVIAGNLLFISGKAKTYAYDLSQSGFPIVWETSATGKYLAISPDNILLISDETIVQAVSLTPWNR